MGKMSYPPVRAFQPRAGHPLREQGRLPRSRPYSTARSIVPDQPAITAPPLLDRAAEDAARRGARFLLAEVPEDPALAPGHELLRRAGFRVESRIPDFVREGIGIAFVRRDLA